MESKNTSHTEFTPVFEGDYVSKEILTVVKNAGKLAIDLQKSGLQAQVKTSKEDLVTQGDLFVTSLLKKELLKQFLDIAFIDEETSSTHSTGVDGPDLYALIDPIDGTTNYYNGDENWGISIGFVKGGHVLAGIIYQPSTDKMFYAEKGKGAFVNHQKLSVSTQHGLTQSNPYFDFPYPKDKAEYDLTTSIITNFSEKFNTHQPIKLGSQVIEIMKVALGEADFFFHLKTKPWDVAAAISIVIESGGKVVNKTGKPYKLFEENIVISNGMIELQSFFEQIKKLQLLV